MKIQIIIIASIFALPFFLKAQTEGNHPEKIAGDSIYMFVEKRPQFPGGEAGMQQFIIKNRQYPQFARENGVEGRVIFGVVVEKDGSLSNLKIRRGLGYDCDEEAMRLLKLMPKWVPGQQNGQPVRCQANNSIRFSLTGEEDDVENNEVMSDSPTTREDSPEPTIEKEEPERWRPYEIKEVDEPPTFPGGADSLKNFIAQNRKYPAAAKTAGVQGTVVIEFVVGKDGSLGEFHSLGKLLEHGLERESFGIVKKMPNWSPGRKNGKPVRVKQRVEIEFKLD